jgi:hypothetical protein
LGAADTSQAAQISNNRVFEIAATNSANSETHHIKYSSDTPTSNAYGLFISHNQIHSTVISTDFTNRPVYGIYVDGGLDYNLGGCTIVGNTIELLGTASEKSIGMHIEKIIERLVISNNSVKATIVGMRIQALRGSCSDNTIYTDCVGIYLEQFFGSTCDNNKILVRSIAGINNPYAIPSNDDGSYCIFCAQNLSDFVLSNNNTMLWGGTSGSSTILAYSANVFLSSGCRNFKIDGEKTAQNNAGVATVQTGYHIYILSPQGSGLVENCHIDNRTYLSSPSGVHGIYVDNVGTSAGFGSVLNNFIDGSNFASGPGIDDLYVGGGGASSMNIAVGGNILSGVVNTQYTISGLNIFNLPNSNYELTQVSPALFVAI